MNRTATKTAFFTAIALSTGFAAQSASAALITNFDYTVDSAFSNFTDDGDPDGEITASGNGFNSDPTQLSWGTTNPQSSISITPQVSGDIQTNGPAEAGATFTHVNNPIPDTSASLSTFVLSTKLNLTSTMPESEAGAEPTVPALTFSSFFTETDNQAPCGDSNSGSVCDDIFVLSDTSGFDQATAGQTFTEDGIEYTVMLEILDLGTLTDEQCGLAGADSGCVGFTTLEDATNDFNTRFTITAAQQAVPEPSTLAMMGLGLGLVGFGVFSRRRNLQA